VKFKGKWGQIYFSPKNRSVPIFPSKPFLTPEYVKGGEKLRAAVFETLTAGQICHVGIGRIEFPVIVQHPGDRRIESDEFQLQLGQGRCDTGNREAVLFRMKQQVPSGTHRI